MVELNHPKLSIEGQCHLVGTSRSWFYRWPLPENAINLEAGRLIDKQFMARRWSDSCKLSRALRLFGNAAGRKRVNRLVAKVGISSIYQKPMTTVPHLIREQVA